MMERLLLMDNVLMAAQLFPLEISLPMLALFVHLAV